MARKEKDGLLSQDHQYACKSHSYLTPPRTPSFEVLGDDDDDSDFLDKDAFLPEQFSLYMSSAFAHPDDTDPFFDFAEDFQDLRQPLLKKDCMWGTAAQIRSSRTSPECSSDSVTTCSMRNMTATPLPLDFRSMTTTPVYFDTSYGSNHFMPISSTVSPSEIENRPKDLISPFRASSNSQVAQLLSPNETESEDEIDVVGVPERSKSHQSTTSMTSSEQVPQTTKEKPKKATTHAINSPPNVSSGLSDSEDSSGSQPRIMDPDDTNTSRSRSQTANVRVSHNDLERKRRDELKRKFDCLRAVIPEIENNERAPKVVILKKASAYVSLLQGQENALRVEKENVRKINGMLMQKLLLMSKRV